MVEKLLRALDKGLSLFEAWTLFVTVFVAFSDVKRITVGTAVTSATLLIIVSGAACFGWSSIFCC